MPRYLSLPAIFCHFETGNRSDAAAVKNRFNDPYELNTPAEMLARAALILMLLGFAGGTVLVVAGLVLQQWQLLGAGGGAWTAGVCIRRWLKHAGQFEAAKESLDALGEPTTQPASSSVAELTELLRQWEALEQQRGTPGFDPWALQAIRHDIRELVARDPALDALFQEFKQRHAA